MKKFAYLGIISLLLIVAIGVSNCAKLPFAGLSAEKVLNYTRFATIVFQIFAEDNELKIAGLEGLSNWTDNQIVQAVTIGLKAYYAMLNPEEDAARSVRDPDAVMIQKIITRYQAQSFDDRAHLARR